MDRMFFALSLGLAGFVWAAHSAQAQGQCAPHQLVLDQLTGSFGESRKAIGLAGATAVMELYASDTTGSWTIIVTMPDGTSCLIAAGEAFEPVSDSLPAKGDPA